MTNLLTAAQMRAIEQAAIDSGEVTGLDLMERAGRGVVEAIFEEWPDLAKTSHRAVVLCGPGNNGGDGFVIARLLKEWGWEVEVFLYGDPDKLPPDARVNWERWGQMGETLPLIEGTWERSPKSRDGQFTALSHFPDPYDLVIDALFGAGLNRSLPSDLRNFIHCTLGNPANASKTIAIDAPTGICMDSGKKFDTHDTTVAGVTATFHRPRIGQFLGYASGNCGKIRVVDIGLDAIYAAAKKRKTNRNAAFRKVWSKTKSEPVRLAVPKVGHEMRKHPWSHKFSHGHALILSGGPGTTGAARLAARGALRIGAGLVTLGVPPSAQLEAASHLTAIMLARIPDADALAARLEDDRLTALCLGPALGLGDREAALVASALRRMGNPVAHQPPAEVGNANVAHPTDRPDEESARPPGSGPGRRIPTVLDADALTLLSRDADLFSALHDRCVLTPHAGEFRRLFPEIADRLDAPATTGPAYSKVDATRDAARRAGCTVLFKGPDTVIADQTGRAAINASAYERAAPWLATAGSGDVLAGIITGLLARGFSPFHAAETGAWLHTECALSFGPGLIAEDLPEELPKVLARLLRDA